MGVIRMETTALGRVSVMILSQTLNWRAGEVGAPDWQVPSPASDSLAIIAYYNQELPHPPSIILEVLQVPPLKSE